MIRIITILFILLSSTSAFADRAYVLRGQGGYITSSGMDTLAGKIEKLGFVVSTHNYGDVAEIIDSIRRLPRNEKVVLIGYSLGAHSILYVSNSLPNRRFALLVSYDPSIYSAYQKGPGPNVDRLLLYHNNGSSTYGHARIRGSQVETTEINESHFSVDDDQALHMKTLAAIRRIR